MTKEEKGYLAKAIANVMTIMVVLHAVDNPDLAIRLFIGSLYFMGAYHLWMFVKAGD